MDGIVIRWGIMDIKSVEKTKEQLSNELKVLQQKFDLLSEKYLEKCQKLLNDTGEMGKAGGWKSDLKTTKHPRIKEKNTILTPRGRK